jgi:hypothetical protein
MPDESKQPRRISAGVLTFLLWIVTAILGLVDILAVRNILIRVYSGTGGRDSFAAANMANWAVVGMAFVWIVVIVGGGEYHRSRVGQRGSWILFGVTLAVEIILLILGFFV